MNSALPIHVATSKKQPIDPICALCRIVSLNFQTTNTKIGMAGHSINIQKPSYIQGILRIYAGDSKEDISELFQPIINLIMWFLVPQKEIEQDASTQSTANIKQDENDERKFTNELKKMIRYMCAGLERLQDTYGMGNVILAIQYYINILRDGLEGKTELRNAIPKCLIETLQIDSNLKNRILGTWNYRRLRVISQQYDNCFKILQENPPNKDKIISGFLMSINSTLSVYEEEFQQQLIKWG